MPNCCIPTYKHEDGMFTKGFTVWHTGLISCSTGTSTRELDPVTRLLAASRVRPRITNPFATEQELPSAACEGRTKDLSRAYCKPV